MRKITQQAVEAFMNETAFKRSNTTVTIENGVAVMRLYGNLIANKIEDQIQITNAGWFSNTTKERLNGIPGVSIRQKRGDWYLNGEQWDGTLINI